MPLFLGLDCSTQSLTAVVIDTAAERIQEKCSVNFGADLPEYGAPNGVIPSSDPNIRHADPLMWCAALDLLFERLKKSSIPLDDIRGISGSGQQHGSVYLNAAFPAVLANLDPSKPLPEQIAPALARKTSPVWMDSSTSAEIAEIAAATGKRLASDSGSAATERFTGPQIRKFWKQSPESYEKTAQIHLVSSFISSILAGTPSPIDFGDGAGMNLLNLHTLQWDPEFAAATATNLLAKLPPAVPSATKLGRVSKYFVDKYGIAETAECVAWSGDNPNSLVGVGASSPGTAVLSLGTSDTFFAAMETPSPNPEGHGHVFGNPAGGFMALICFANGSLAREKVRDACGLDWKGFDNAVMAAEPGNGGNLMLPYFEPEITPFIPTPGIKLKGDDHFVAGNAPAHVQCRAIVESQLLSIKSHSKWISDKTPFETMRITGGGANSRSIRTIAADVFQTNVETISIPDSAALGAAERAAAALGNATFEELAATYAAPSDIQRPDMRLKSLYADMEKKFAGLEQTAIQTITGK